MTKSKSLDKPDESFNDDDNMIRAENVKLAEQGQAPGQRKRSTRQKREDQENRMYKEAARKGNTTSR